jgi:catechol 2,3-dioxygenase-like lactoylglutathione lyase family enzyme
MIKVTDVAWGRLSVPDLDRMETFLLDFGMSRAARTDGALFMRGNGPEHHIHVTERGDPRFIGMAFHAASAADLETVARADGASAVEETGEPGGGTRVRLTDPNGFQVEIVHGVATVAPRDEPARTHNTGTARRARAGDLLRVPKAPSHVKRCAHVVIRVPALEETLAWYRGTLGLVPSDSFYAGPPDNIIGSFNRVDRGPEFVDHHTLFCMQTEDGAAAELGHLAFEVTDFDDVQAGHDYLKATGKYDHAWGIGRHVLGSQVFDYWNDPWGFVHEHTTDTDMVNADHPHGVCPVEVGLSNQWGPPHPGGSLSKAAGNQG